MDKNYLIDIFNIIKYNLKTLIKFEFLFKLILSLILMPIALSLFNLIMKLTGYTYLTIENIIDFILNPLTLLLLLIIIVFLTMITIFDISTLIIIFNESYNKSKITVVDSIKISFTKCKNLFKFKNILVAFLVLFLIPFLKIGLSSNVIVSIKIPEFIIDYINSNWTLFIIYFIIYFLLLSLMFKWLFSLHYMILEDRNFKDARKKSRSLIKGRKTKTYLKILLVELIIAILFIIFIIVGIIGISFIYKWLKINTIISSFLITLIWLFISISIMTLAFVSNGLSYSIISSLFYNYKITKKENIISMNYDKVIDNNKKSKGLKFIGLVIIVLTIIGGSCLTYQVITGQTNLNIEFIRKIEITAHRGASVKYPENTMSAFRGAKEFGADWIELDVQQTKDKQIVVTHDTNLLRITGLNKDIIDMDYEDIRKLDAGSFFDKKYSNEYIPLLSEVLDYAKDNNIRLNIELKPTGKEKDFEQQVVELLHEYSFIDRCVITSQTYSVLENIKNIDEDIKTVYVMSIAIGNIIDLKYADAFSVEVSNVNNSLVSMVHNDGKELYVWTVNNEESINKMIDMNVDNIITDNIELARELIIKSRNSNLI